MRASFLRLSRRYLRQDRATKGASARAGGRGRWRPRASIAAAGRGCLACGGGGGPSRRSRRFRGASGSAGAAAYCHGLAGWAAFPRLLGGARRLLAAKTERVAGNSRLLTGERLKRLRPGDWGGASGGSAPPQASLRAANRSSIFDKRAGTVVQ